MDRRARVHGQEPEQGPDPRLDAVERHRAPVDLEDEAAEGPHPDRPARSGGARPIQRTRAVRPTRSAPLGGEHRHELRRLDGRVLDDDPASAGGSPPTPGRTSPVSAAVAASSWRWSAARDGSTVARAAWASCRAAGVPVARARLSADMASSRASGSAARDAARAASATGPRLGDGRAEPPERVRRGLGGSHRRLGATAAGPGRRELGQRRSPRVLARGRGAVGDGRQRQTVLATQQLADRPAESRQPGGARVLGFLDGAVERPRSAGLARQGGRDGGAEPGRGTGERPGLAEVGGLVEHAPRRRHLAGRQEQQATGDRRRRLGAAGQLTRRVPGVPHEPGAQRPERIRRRQRRGVQPRGEGDPLRPRGLCRARGPEARLRVGVGRERGRPPAVVSRPPRGRQRDPRVVALDGGRQLLDPAALAARRQPLALAAQQPPHGGPVLRAGVRAQRLGVGTLVLEQPAGPAVPRARRRLADTPRPASGPGAGGGPRGTGRRRCRPRSGR